MELAELYRALGDALYAQGQSERAELWYAKSASLKKFRRSATNNSDFPMPAELPSKKLP